MRNLLCYCEIDFSNLKKKKKKLKLEAKHSVVVGGFRSIDSSLVCQERFRVM